MRWTTLVTIAVTVTLTAPLVAREAAAPQPAAVAIARVTLAATNVPAMTRFYNDVFAAGLRPSPVGGVTMQLGTLAGLELLLCPNDIAKVDAALNRHMLRIVVEDVASVLERVRGSGGTVDGPLSVVEGRRLAAVRDPDGNTIELVERQP